MDKSALMKMVAKIEDKVLVSRLLDKVEQCRYSSFVYSDFLSPYEAAVAKKVLDRVKDIFYYFYGGYEGAERVIAVISADFVSEEDLMQAGVPVGFLRIIPKAEKPLSHRDYLGSLLGLGIKREKVGDIVVCESHADVFLMDTILEYVECNLDKIGSARVSCERRDVYNYSAPDKKEKLIKTTVASLRADSVAASGFGVSRTKVLDYFRAQRVNINWELVQNPSKSVAEGDVISIRGKGRIVLETVVGTTKKDRMNIVIKRFE